VFKFYQNLTRRMGGCGFGGLGVACWPLVPKFAVSNPAKDVGFFRKKKSSAYLPSKRK
jgi:hypothetical protein